MTPPILIIGLGNPGRRYHDTRHNIGFRVLDTLAKQLHATWSTTDGRTLALAEVRADDATLLLAKPQQFMNRAGGPIGRLVRRRKIPCANVWVVLDDLDLPFGHLRLRPKGSAGGHHGMESILVALGTDAVPRLKIGIGPKVKNANFDGAAFVLHDFAPKERTALPRHVDQAVDALLTASKHGFEAAMNVWNRKGAQRLHP